MLNLFRKRSIDRDINPISDLYQPQKMESLGRLTGGVAHDFNNLLTVVLGNATALRKSAESRGDTRSVQLAEVIERSAERGGRIASQLLAYSRKQALRPEPVNVGLAIQGILEILTNAASEKVRLILKSDSDLWSCNIDLGQFESVIVNLVLNARDAMPIGGDITISSQNKKITFDQAKLHDCQAGDFIKVEVRDNGTGIDPKILDRIFEPFFTTKPVGSGSGLGLSQVYGFAGQSGGWIDVESEIGLAPHSHFICRDIRSLIRHRPKKIPN